MNVIVTGATSFIGAAVVRELLRRGDRVCAVVRPGSKNLAYLETMTPPERRENLRIITLDLSEIEQLPLVPGKQPCAWLHAAWDGPGSENRARRDVQQRNVELSLGAVRTAAALGCRRFVFTGSQAEYGVRHGVTAETAACNPVSEYGRAKADFAVRAQEFCRGKNLEYIHTRIFSVYGPGDHPWSLVNSCLHTFRAGEEMRLSDCRQLWNFLYIDDAARALVCLLRQGNPGFYNVGSADTRVLRDYVETMYELCGCRGSFVYGGRGQNTEGASDLAPDISKICTETEWRPTTTFEEGIYETMSGMRL